MKQKTSIPIKNVIINFENINRMAKCLEKQENKRKNRI